MTERVIGPTGSPRRRWTLLLPLTLAIVVGLFYIAGAQATATAFFELEGNTADAAGTPNLDDWANLYNSGGAAAPHGAVCTAAVTTNCFDTFALSADKIGKEGDNSYFTGGGSKDREDITQWQWGPNDQSPDKNDITNAFAAAYRDNNSLALAFGADRHAVNGDAQIGFWFNQAPMCLSGGTPAGVAPNCPASTPNQGTTTGKFVDPASGALAEHQQGDILALVNFDNGGTIGLAGVYRWNDTTNQVDQVLSGTGIECKGITYPTDFCTTSNTADLTGEPPWPYNAKGGGADDDYEQSAFIEGFIDLGSISGAGTCFPSFLAETRSSSGPSTGLSLDAQLKDFALKSFQLCGSSLTTTPKDGGGSSIPAGGLSITTAGSIQVKDEAAVTVTGISTWSGTVQFYLCKLDSGTCDNSGDTGDAGTAIGSPQAVNQATSTILSPAATVTSAGRYCWRAFFDSNTAGVSDQTHFDATECFTVNPVTPTITTQVVQTVVSPGASVSDKAFLTGTANQPGTPVINPTTAGGVAGGTITFKLYGPTTTTTASCIDSGTGANLVFTSAAIAVSGDRPGPATFYGSGTTTLNSPGYYHWVASYSGNSPNTNTASGSCGDSNEMVQVQQLQPTISTAQSFVPNDSATISVASGAGNLDGSVVFRMWVDNSACSGTATYTSSAIDIDTGQPNPGTAGLTKTVSSGNTVAYSTTGKTFHWTVTYTSDNAGHLPVTSPCGVEHSSITIQNSGTPNS